jgi:hypothetical protein
MRFPRAILLCVMLLLGSNREVLAQEGLEIAITDTILFFSNERDDEPTLRVRLTNYTTDTLQIYGLNNIYNNPLGSYFEEIYCREPNLAAGVLVVVKSGAEIHEIETSFHSEELPRRFRRQTVEEIQNEGRRRLLSGVEILEPNYQLITEVAISIKEYELDPGEYQLQMVIYGGSTIMDFLGNASAAKLGLPFVGCSYSNEIRAVVESEPDFSK